MSIYLILHKWNGAVTMKSKTNCYDHGHPTIYPFRPTLYSWSTGSDTTVLLLTDIRFAGFNLHPSISCGWNIRLNGRSHRTYQRFKMGLSFGWNYCKPAQWFKFQADLNTIAVSEGSFIRSRKCSSHQSRSLPSKFSWEFFTLDAELAEVNDMNPDNSVKNYLMQSLI